MPMVNCPQCDLRQYAAAPYVEQPRCVACDAPLGRPKAEPPSIGNQIVDLARARATNRDSG